MQILVGFGFNSNEHLEGQLVHEERIQSTATDKISTITFRNLTLLPVWLPGPMFLEGGGVVCLWSHVPFGGVYPGGSLSRGSRSGGTVKSERYTS